MTLKAECLAIFEPKFPQKCLNAVTSILFLRLIFDQSRIFLNLSVESLRTIINWTKATFRVTNGLLKFNFTEHHSSKSICFLNGPFPPSFSFTFSLFRTNIIFIQLYSEKGPSCIWCWDSNPQPLECESPPITTRPSYDTNSICLRWQSIQSVVKFILKLNVKVSIVWRTTSVSVTPCKTKNSFL